MKSACNSLVEIIFQQYTTAANVILVQKTKWSRVHTLCIKSKRASSSKHEALQLDLKFAQV